MPSRRAFTLIEILVGSIVFALMITMVYKLFISGGQQMAYGTWRSGTTMQMRNNLRRLKEDINKASYRSNIQDLNVVVERELNQGHWFRFVNGPPADTADQYNHNEALTPATPRKTLLQWHICESGRRMPDNSVRNPTVIEAKIDVEGSDLIYSKTSVDAGGSPAPEDLFPERVIVADVTNFNFKVMNTDPSTTEGWTIQLYCRTQYPNATKGKEVFLEQSITAKIPVQIMPF